MYLRNKVKASKKKYFTDPILERLRRQPCSMFNVYAHCAYSFFRGVMLLTSRYHSVQHLLACFTSETFSSMCFIINCSITSLAEAASRIMPMTMREYHHQSLTRWTLQQRFLSWQQQYRRQEKIHYGWSFLVHRCLERSFGKRKMIKGKYIK